MTDELSLSSEIGRLLKDRGLWLATAESCTGGLLGHLITNVAGSSEYYLGGFITYSNSTKEQWLGVKSNTLKINGAVSKATVLEMAWGVRKAFNGRPDAETIVGISISGIAGPSGGTPDKPVGTVWIGISGTLGNKATCFLFMGSRTQIQSQAARQSLKILAHYLI